MLIRSHVRRVEEVLKGRLLPTPDVQRLVWVPGIGKLGAYTLVLEVDDIHRFFHTAAIRAAQYHPAIRQEYRRLARRKGKIVARR